MYIQIKHTDGPSPGLMAIAAYIQGCLACHDGDYSITVHPETEDEHDEITRRWQLTEQDLEDLED